MAKAPSKQAVWVPIVPVPDNAPPHKSKHSHRGEPTWAAPYRDDMGRLLGYTCRFIKDSGEAELMTLTWCEDKVTQQREWRFIQFERLRPVFGADALALAAGHVEPAEGEFYVRAEAEFFLVCADEHAASRAQALMPRGEYEINITALSWPGGARNVQHVDWSALKGQMVWVMPKKTMDRTKVKPDEPPEGLVLPRDKQSGWRDAVKLEKVLREHGAEVAGIIDPWADESLAEGWDAGMAAASGWSSEQFRTWLFDHSAQGKGPPWKVRVEAANGNPEAQEEIQQEKAVRLAWHLKLKRDKFNDVTACLANVHDILTHDDAWKGVIGFNEFSLRIEVLKKPPYWGEGMGEWKPGIDWTENDDSRTAMWLTRCWGIAPTSATVAEAIRVIAQSNAYHPPREWLRGLVWDKTPRLKFWLRKTVGCDDTPYSRRVAGWYLMGAVKRVLSPGCKFDYCLVLMGPQGKGKSTVFSILGGDWFGDAELDLGNKDAMAALAGKMFFEIPELGALARSDERRQKAFMSRTVDEYRPPYGRHMIKAPRQGVFGGTTNEDEWNKDPTGGRRFWPILCLGEIDHAWLRENRDQLFAEAYQLVMDGHKYWPDEREQRELFNPQQAAVEQQDGIVDLLHDWVYTRGSEFSLAQAAEHVLGSNPFGGLDAAKLTRDMQTRIGQALKKLGCTRVERRNGMIRYWYKPPQKAATSGSEQGNKKPEYQGEEAGHEWG